jgi:hypothetical protein
MEPRTKTDLRRGAHRASVDRVETTEAEQACLLADDQPSVQPAEEVAQGGDPGDSLQHGD